MIVTIVRFEPDPDEREISVEEARARFGGNAVDYLDVPGLLWKAYLLGEDGRTVGGTYWWTDRQSAENKFNAGWFAGVTEKYGRAPTVEWFEAPVVVDARFDVVRVDAPPQKANLRTESSTTTEEPAG